MKRLHDFVNENEAKNIEGKSPEKNGTKGLYAIDEPKDDEAAKMIDLNDPENTESMEDLIDKFDTEDPFFIEGRAGWGKTSVIRSLAKKFNRKVITVYLDKAQKEDIGGLPIPVKDKNNVAVQEMALPEWAKIMWEDDKSKYLLFFDEMNQADPGIMNALMPVILETTICGLKFDNFMVGCAGNLMEENEGGLTDIRSNKALYSRLKPIITWETNTDNAWKQAFKHLHREYDKVVGEELIDILYENRNLFDNPREIDHKVINYCIKISSNEDAKNRTKVEKVSRRLEGLAKEELSRSEENQLKRLAENLVKFITSDGAGMSHEKKKTSREMIDENLRKALISAFKKGYYKEAGITYGISKENASGLVDPKEINAEMMQNLIMKFEADGGKFKYETSKEWKKEHPEWTDPDEPDEQ